LLALVSALAGAFARILSKLDQGRWELSAGCEGSKKKRKPPPITERITKNQLPAIELTMSVKKRRWTLPFIEK